MNGIFEPVEFRVVDESSDFAKWWWQQLCLNQQRPVDRRLSLRQTSRTNNKFLKIFDLSFAVYKFNKLQQKLHSKHYVPFSLYRSIFYIYTVWRWYVSLNFDLRKLSCRKVLCLLLYRNDLLNKDETYRTRCVVVITKLVPFHSICNLIMNRINPTVQFIWLNYFFQFIFSCCYHNMMHLGWKWNIRKEKLDTWTVKCIRFHFRLLRLYLITKKKKTKLDVFCLFKSFICCLWRNIRQSVIEFRFFIWFSLGVKRLINRIRTQ